MENISQELPEDLQRLILSWMPLKSLMKFKCVSKKWESIMGDKCFQDLHYERSKTRPRVLIASCRRLVPNPEILFHSVDQEEKLLLSSGQQHVHFPDITPHEVYAPIRGLICLGTSATVVICNPGTRKYRTLPEIPGARYGVCFLGYADVTKVYKVLCIANVPSGKSDGSTKDQAFTMGLGEESWRPIVCEHEHRPTTDHGIWKGEVLYYGAVSETTKDSIVMSFNIRSEEFNVIDFPKSSEVSFWDRNSYGGYAILINYKGNIAYVRDSRIRYDNREIQMLVRNETSGKWLEDSIMIPPWRELSGFMFQGIIGTGELVFTEKGYNLHYDGSFSVVYYNEDTKKHKTFKIDIGGVGDSEMSKYVKSFSFFNHVDSLSLP